MNDHDGPRLAHFLALIPVHRLLDEKLKVVTRLLRQLTFRPALRRPCQPLRLRGQRDEVLRRSLQAHRAESRNEERLEQHRRAP